MVRAAFEKFCAWWLATAWPLTTGIATEWWKDIGDMPRPHFVSMVIGMVILYAVKLAVWLVT